MWLEFRRVLFRSARPNIEFDSRFYKCTSKEFQLPSPYAALRLRQCQRIHYILHWGVLDFNSFCSGAGVLLLCVAFIVLLLYKEQKLQALVQESSLPLLENADSQATVRRKERHKNESEAVVRQINSKLIQVLHLTLFDAKNTDQSTWVRFWLNTLNIPNV